MLAAVWAIPRWMMLQDQAEVMLRALRTKYWLKRMATNVAEWLRSLCDCQSWEAPIAPLTATEDPMKPWQTVSVDILGPFEDVRPTHRFLLILTDVFSRWVDAEPASPCMSNSSKKLSIVSGIPLILSPTALLHRNPYPGDAIYSEVT